MTDLDRRRFMMTGLAGLPLAAVLADAKLAKAVAGTLSTVELTTAEGRKVSGALALPDAAPAPAVLLVHEWWGLNDQIKSVARALADEGYLALAVDLYDGKLAKTPEGARGFMQAVVDGEARDTLSSWITWLRAHEASKGSLGTVGWCFGGGWSLNASIDSAVEATVIYYGRVNQPADELARLQGPVLGHFATLDQWIDQEMVAGFEKNMTALGKAYSARWYEAAHAFANPSSGRYDQADARIAWQRTLEFYQKHLRG